MIPTGPHLHLQLLPALHAVARLPADAALPGWFAGPGFRTASWTADELSLVCEQARVPAGAGAEPDWRCLKLIGPFAFELTGILRAVLDPLAEAGIGIFAISTFDTDYVLVKQHQLESAVRALRAAGHHVAVDDAAFSPAPPA